MPSGCAILARGSKQSSWSDDASCRQLINSFSNGRLKMNYPARISSSEVCPGFGQEEICRLPNGPIPPWSCISSAGEELQQLRAETGSELLETGLEFLSF